MLQYFASIQIFQSTHPTRGCDVITILTDDDLKFQSTHPTRGCDLESGRYKSMLLFQSTHPTRGCDKADEWLEANNFAFQSTHPTRGCDFKELTLRFPATISIHAPHEGVRRVRVLDIFNSDNFNPRTPRGGATTQTPASNN